MLYFTAFASGLTVLALELSAARLLGPYFGVSEVVWSAIIGLILIYLTIGYFLGGRWADQSPQAGTLYRVMAWGALTAGLIPVLARPILLSVSQSFDQLALGPLPGAFAGVLALYLVPITLLGTISPFVIRLLLQDARYSGQVAGQVYAVSTLGSFVGSFLPSLVMIPLLGTRLTFFAFSGFLLAVALLGLWRFAGPKAALGLVWMPVLLGGAAFLWGRAPLKTDVGQLFEGESTYNYIQVIEQNGYRSLKLNEGQGIHSMYHPVELNYAGPWEQFLAAPFFNANYTPKDVQRIAIVGLAAGTTARQASAVFGSIPIDGYEIDAQIIEVGRQFFGMADLPNLNAFAVDGRWGLMHSRQSYSLIVVDAYRPPYIPWQLTTREFFSLAAQQMTPDGALAINVGRTPTDRRLIEALVATLQTVFPSVYVMDLPNTFNSIIYATRQPTRVENFYANYLSLQANPSTHPLLREVMARAIVNFQPVVSGQIIFTDDRAPIEWFTHQLILGFVLE